MKLLTCLAMLALTTSVQAASTHDSDLPDEVRALLMKEKAKGTLRANTAEVDRNRRSGSGSNSGCNMDIGNVNSNGRSGTPRTVTTIVTGPVIQMNNKCN